MDIRKPVPTIYGDWQEKFRVLWERQTNKIHEVFGLVIEKIDLPFEHPVDIPVIYVKKSGLLEVLRFLKTEPGFEYGFLADHTATDETKEPRFHIVFNLLSHSVFSRIRVKTMIQDNEECPSIISLWKGADWAEREIWDMFGIKFTGHPNLKRILMDERWVGHPLRKDYPLRKYQLFPAPMPPDPKQLEG